MSDKVKSRFAAISFSPVQNASSRLTLVLCPAMTIERLTTGDFIGFSCLDTVLVELAVKLRPCSLGERAISLRHAVRNSRLGGAFFVTPSIDPFPGRAEVDDISHARPQCPLTSGTPARFPMGYSVGPSPPTCSRSHNSNDLRYGTESPPQHNPQNKPLCE